MKTKIHKAKYSIGEMVVLKKPYAIGYLECGKRSYRAEAQAQVHDVLCDGTRPANYGLRFSGYPHTVDFAEKEIFGAAHGSAAKDAQV